MIIILCKIKQSPDKFILSMYQAFEIDEDQSQKQPQSPLKARQNHFTDKFSKTITKNFMHESQAREQQYHNEPSEVSKKLSYETTRERRKNLRLNSRMLKPLSNPEKTEVQNLADLKLNPVLNASKTQDQQIQQVLSPVRKTSGSPEPLMKHKKSEDAPLQLVNIDIPSRHQANILFYEEEQSDIQDQNIAEQILFPTRNQLPRYLQQIEMSSNLSAFEDVVVRTHTHYFHLQNKERHRKEVFQIVKPLHTLKMILSRDNSGFNTFWPEYFMKFPGDSQPVICAKRTTARPISTFILSLSPTDFEQNSQNYLGKIKSNALGDVLYVYGPGYNPTNAKDKRQRQRQMVATIRYQSSFFSANRPRQFQVFTIKQGFKYFQLKGTKPYGDQPGLDQLFNHESNRDCMNIYSNKKPIWNEQAGGFMLNFRGRVPYPSIKNFILDDPFGHQSIVFGRKQKNEFVLEVTDKISPYIAMAVALSAFDTRIMCE